MASSSCLLPLPLASPESLTSCTRRIPSHFPSFHASFHVFHSPCLLLSSLSRRTVTRRWKEQARQPCKPSCSNSSVPASVYAKEMERVAAKEALLLAIKDAGGGDSGLGPATATEASRIDVNERIVSLERLNPTPRPTTSSFLEGLWQFKWIGAGSPGQFAATVLLKRFPSALATVSEMNILILDGSAKVTATLKLFNTIISNVVLTSKLTVEGPVRLKEEYVEGLLSSPSIQEGTVPPQVQNAYGQFTGVLQQLPVNIVETLSSGIKIPLVGTFERQLLISYLDDEILIARDGSGVPEVLFHVSNTTVSDVEPVPEYVS